MYRVKSAQREDTTATSYQISTHYSMDKSLPTPLRERLLRERVGIFSGHSHVCAQTTHGRERSLLASKAAVVSLRMAPRTRPQRRISPNDMGIQVSKCSRLPGHEHIVLYSYFYSLAGLQLHQQLLPKAVKLAALEHWQCVSEPKHGWAIIEI